MRWRKRQVLACAFFLMASARSYAQVDMDRIKAIESSGNAMAFNVKSKARGLYQITPICLQDYNNFHKVKYTSQDLFNPEINFKVADWYLNWRIPRLLKHFKLEDTVRNRLICFNAGIKAVIKNRIPKETQEYIKKYERR